MFDKKALRFKEYSWVEDEVTDVLIVKEKSDDYLFPYAMFVKSSSETEEEYEFALSVQREDVADMVEEIKNWASNYFNASVVNQAGYDIELVPNSESKSGL